MSFIVTFVVTRNLFNFTHSVTQHLQAKLNDTVLVFDFVVLFIDVIFNVKVNIDFFIFNVKVNIYIFFYSGNDVKML